MKVIFDSDFDNRSPDEVMDVIVDFLLESGNKLARKPRWGSNPTGYLCLLESKSGFDLVELNFKLPDSISIQEEKAVIDYGLGTVTIRVK